MHRKTEQITENREVANSVSIIENRSNTEATYYRQGIISCVNGIENTRRLRQIYIITNSMLEKEKRE